MFISSTHGMRQINYKWLLNVEPVLVNKPNRHLSAVRQYFKYANNIQQRWTSLIQQKMYNEKKFSSATKIKKSLGGHC